MHNLQTKSYKRGVIFTEHENRYASKGQANLNTVLGAVGTGAGILGGNLGNILGGILGGGNCNGNGMYINRYEAEQNAKINALETQNKFLESSIYTDTKLLDLYKYVDGKFSMIEQELCQQRVYNATNTAAINCINGQIAQLMSVTTFGVAQSKICPPITTTAA